jgi:hypothetical protein
VNLTKGTLTISRVRNEESIQGGRKQGNTSTDSNDDVCLMLMNALITPICHTAVSRFKDSTDSGYLGFSRAVRNKPNKTTRQLRG